MRSVKRKVHRAFDFSQWYDDCVEEKMSSRLAMGFFGMMFLAAAGMSPAARDFIGPWPAPLADAIGGGERYSRMVDGGDYRASTKEELIDALARAKEGETVFVANEAVIDMGDAQDIVIPAGVTLAGGRNGAGVAGALIYSLRADVRPLFSTGGEGVRITGLRLRGPDMERRTEHLGELMAEGGHEAYYSIPTADGVISTHAGLEVDNCELWGWSHAAVFLREGATGAHIHHNYIHHNQRSGLGYGVCLDQSDALIEANLFDWCRHHIAGTGRPGTSYEARYNVVFENANGHSFDMHGGRDRGDGTHIAGTDVLIHHNLFLAASVPAVVIRGVPENRCEVHHNWFVHDSPDKAIRQSNAQGKMKVHSNQYTKARVLKD